MGLQINTNVNALNAYRNLTGTQGSMTTSLERLSSGLRINRAADDAAGLAISEKLRSQVNGLNQAQANAQDGVSLIQTAEGALNETHAILQRMRTLAVQSTSDTNTDADRAAIQKEVSALVKEIDSTTTRTQFNGMNLLDGTFKSKQLQIGANTSQTMDINIKAMNTAGLGLSGAPLVNKATVAGAPVADTALNSVVVTAGTDAQGNRTPIVAGTYKVVTGSAAGTLDVTRDGQTVGTVGADGETIQLNDGTTIATGGTLANNDSITLEAKNFTATATVGGAVQKQNGQVAAGTYSIDGTTVKNASGKIAGTINTTNREVTFTEEFGGGKVTFTAAPEGTLTIAAAQDADGNPLASVDLSTKAGATAALKQIDGAIKTVSDQRADLGALQNRLTHTINNLGVSSENLAASESRIRDTDMAKEMTSFTRSQILQQAGVSMLAQANQSSQSVLKLLG